MNNWHLLTVLLNLDLFLMVIILWVFGKNALKTHKIVLRNQAVFSSWWQGYFVCVRWQGLARSTSVPLLSCICLLQAGLRQTRRLQDLGVSLSEMS